jgi:hypothetical protein
LPAPSNFVFPLPISALTFDPSRKFIVPVNYQWNLTMERQLHSDLLFRLAYAGSRGLHQRRDEQLNPVIYNPGASGPYGNPALPSNSRRTYAEPYKHWHGDRVGGFQLPLSAGDAR